MTTPTTAIESNDGLVVSGTGEVNVAPDLARLSLGVQNQARESAEAARVNAEQTARVIAAVRRAGVAEKDIQTANYSIFPQYDSRPRPAGANGAPQGYDQVLTGYQVSNTVRVTVRRIADAGKVLDAATQAGANVAQGISFDLDTPTAARARDEALRQAVADAARKAQILADAAKLGPIRLSGVIESGANVPRPMEFGADRGIALANARVATPVQPGETTVTASVSLRYRFGATGTAASPLPPGFGR